MSSFPKVKLVAVGKIKKGWIREGAAVYQKRLPELSLTEIKDSTPEKEGEHILSTVGSGDRLIALAEEGKTLSSLQFSDFLGNVSSNRVVFAIGSANGLSATVKQSASQLLSLSPMTFPHEIARLLFLEQLYRAKTILQGSRYHK